MPDVRILDIHVDLENKLFTVEGTSNPLEETVDYRCEGGLAADEVKLLREILGKIQKAFPDDDIISL